MEGGESMQTCTVVYGEIDTSGETATARLAVAGHPAPLIVRADGSVETTPAHGTLLGAFRDPAFHTCAVTLDPGDAIVVYSDGILDSDLVDEPRIAELLSGLPHAGAQDLVDRLWNALRGVDRVRDDVAIMALRRTAPAVA
jgi:serine phosphatase RsbU (regulator of sigma subunit)